MLMFQSLALEDVTFFSSTIFYSNYFLTDYSFIIYHVSYLHFVYVHDSELRLIYSDELSTPINILTFRKVYLAYHKSIKVP